MDVAPGSEHGVYHEFRVDYAGATWALNLRVPGPLRQLTTFEDGRQILALRSDALLVSGGEAGEGMALIPYVTGAAGLRPLSGAGGEFMFDLPEAGGVLTRLFIGEDVAHSLVFVPDDGGMPRTVVGTDDPNLNDSLKSLLAAHFEPETGALVLLGRQVFRDAEGRDVVEVTDTVIRVPLDPSNAELVPAVFAPAGLRVQVFHPLPNAGDYLVSGTLGNTRRVWRVRFLPGGERESMGLGPEGLALPPKFFAGVGVVSNLAIELEFDGGDADGFVSEDGSVVLAATDVLGSTESGGRMLFALHTDGRDAVEPEPLAGGVMGLFTDARMFPDGRHVSFLSDEGTMVASIDPRVGAKRLGVSDAGDPYESRYRFDPGPRRAFPRDRGESVAFLERAENELIVLDLDTGQRDVRATFGRGHLAARLTLLQLTPDERAAIVAWTGPAGRRLYLVSLEGPKSVTRLGTEEAFGDERLVTFAP